MVRFEDREIKSISDLLTNLKKDTTNGVKGPVWYRGHARKSWKLVPSLFRKENRKYNEEDLIKEFKQDALLLVHPIPEEQIDWLMVMRHNHVPTRLLDWTENPLIAIHFALFDDTNPVADEDGALWMLSPFELNKLTDFEEGSLPSFKENKDDVEQWTPELYSSKSERAKHKPIAFVAPRNSTRMQAQQSVFTIHHKIDVSIEEIDEKIVWRYIIPKDVKKNILDELHLLGINIFQIYPEIDRIFDKIKETKP